MRSWTYETVLGYFAHDDISKLPLPAVPPHFGLNDTSDDRWARLRDVLKNLNDEAPAGTVYKFILLSRHGQGFHNVAEAKYGTAAWDDYWAKQDGDGEIVWGPDPQLTPVGIEQAQAIRDVWITEAANGLYPPDRRYSSPLTRAMHTCHIMFDEVYESHPQKVLVMENCREENGVHTCDKRNTRSFIASTRPEFAIEDSLTEEDELWNPTTRETKAEVAARAKTVLDTIFEEEDQMHNNFISITAHGGFITGFLTAVDRALFILPTGGILPVVVKGSSCDS